MKYGELNLGQIEAMVNKLGGIDGVQRFLANGIVIAGVWKTWRKVTLGTCLRNPDDFREAIKQSGMKIRDWANDILAQPAFAVAREKIEVELINVSVAELGFKDGATYQDICLRACGLDLDLCPNEVGPHLRLQYKDQPKNELLVVAMNAITSSSGCPTVFCVERDGGALCLRGLSSSPSSFWNGDNRFLFLRRK